MRDDSQQLGRLQRWMQTVIMHPQGIRGGIESDEARRELDLHVGEVERVVLPSRTLSSVERLEIYGNAYFARLQECLRAEFPAVLHAVGESAFSAFVFGYLQQYPSTSYTLGQLGAMFPRYLEETRPDDSDDMEMPQWTAFLVELARLERLYSEVFDGPGPEQDSLLTPDFVASISPEQWPFARPTPIGCLHLLELQFPVHEYITAVRESRDPEWPAPARIQLAVFRRDYIVRRVPLSPAQFAILSALQAGATVEEAIGRAVEVHEGDFELLANCIGKWFHEWTAAGLFQSIELHDEV